MIFACLAAFHACLSSCSGHIRCRWHTHLTNHGYFDHRKSWISPIRTPCLEENDADSCISGLNLQPTLNSSVASPICQERQSERTFLILAFASWIFLFFSIFPWLFLSFPPLFPIFDTFFTVKGGTLPPCPYTGYATDSEVWSKATALMHMFCPSIKLCVLISAQFWLQLSFWHYGILILRTLLCGLLHTSDRTEFITLTAPQLHLGNFKNNRW